MGTRCHVHTARVAVAIATLSPAAALAHGGESIGLGLMQLIVVGFSALATWFLVSAQSLRRQLLVWLLVIGVPLSWVIAVAFSYVEGVGPGTLFFIFAPAWLPLLMLGLGGILWSLRRRMGSNSSSSGREEA